MPVVQRLIWIRVERRFLHASNRLHRRRRMNVVKKRGRPVKSFVSHQLFGVQSAVGLSKHDVPLTRNRTKRVVVRHSEIPSKFLLSLYRFEECLEIPGTKTLRAFPFDDLIENRRPILDRLREYLKQVPLVIAIDENPQIAQRVEIFIDMTNAI